MHHCFRVVTQPKKGVGANILPKIWADSGQFSLKFGEKSGKSEDIGIKSWVNDLIIPRNQPWSYVLRFFHKVFYEKSKIRCIFGAYFPIAPNLTLVALHSLRNLSRATQTTHLILQPKHNRPNKLGLSCAKLSSSWLQAYSASDWKIN